jgi:ribosomal protein S18 acetylase RimI-like enzyme
VAANSTTIQQITLATLADVPQLAALVNKAYRGESATRGWTSEAHLLDGTRIDEETLSQYITGEHSLILKYMGLQEQIEGCVYLELTGNAVYLGMLTVDPDLQNSGIGKQMLKQAEVYAVGQHRDRMRISVLDSRVELIAWYERHGYKKTGDVLPFPTETKFGLPKQPLQLIVMEKLLV